MKQQLTTADIMPHDEWYRDIGQYYVMTEPRTLTDDSIGTYVNSVLYSGLGKI